MKSTVDTENTEIYNGLRIIRGTTIGGQPTATIYAPKAKRPYVNYCYASVEKCENAIKQYKKNFDDHKATVQARRDKKKNMTNPYVVGDVVVNSWGWEQTNIDFYQVVEVKNKSVMLQAIYKKDVTDDNAGISSMSGHCVAVPGCFREGSEPFLKKLYDEKGGINFRHGWGHKWDGRKEYYSWYA